jgi:hypothetical protein
MPCNELSSGVHDDRGNEIRVGASLAADQQITEVVLSAMRGGDREHYVVLHGRVAQIRHHDGVLLAVHLDWLLRLYGAADRVGDPSVRAQWHARRLGR